MEAVNNNAEKQNDKIVFRIVMGVTLVVCVLVVLLNKKIFPVPEVFPHFIYKLPMINAFINGTCSVLLIFSLLAIKRRQITLHKRLNLTAFFLSVLFLLSYVTAHYFIPDTKYGDLNRDGLVSDSEYSLVSGIKPSTLR